MILGQSAATAASMAIDEGVAVQVVSYAKLREQLLKDGQVLEWTSAAPEKTSALLPPQLGGIVLDDADAERTGEWLPGSIVDCHRIQCSYIP